MTKKRNEELENLQKKVDELEAQLKRAVADYRNLELRISQGKSEFFAWATSELILKILPIVDNLEKAVGGVSEAEKSSGWFKGVELSVKQLQEILKSEGVEEIETDGQFDPSLHEAVDTKDGEDNMILEVVRKGYKLQGKVLRPAHVVVGKYFEADEKGEQING